MWSVSSQGNSGLPVNNKGEKIGLTSMKRTVELVNGNLRVGHPILKLEVRAWD